MSEARSHEEIKAARKGWTESTRIREVKCDLRCALHRTGEGAQ